MSTSKLEYGLLENGLDSLNEAIAFYIKAEDDIKYYKYSILLLAHGIELILKQLLHDENELLLFQDIDEIGRKSKSECLTITVDKAIYRLKNICKIDLPSFCIESINEIKKERNIIQHYKVDINKEVATKIFSNGYSAIKYILGELSYQPITTHIDEEVFEKLTKIEKKYKHDKQASLKLISEKSLKRIFLEFKEKEKVFIPCPICGEKYLVDSEGVVKCYYCFCVFENLSDTYYWDERKFISNELKRQASYRKSTDFSKCPDCESDFCMLKNDGNSFLCLDCLHEFDSFDCDNCGLRKPNGKGERFMAEIDSADSGMDYEYVCKECSNSKKYFAINPV